MVRRPSWCDEEAWEALPPEVQAEVAQTSGEGPGEQARGHKGSVNVVDLTHTDEDEEEDEEEERKEIRGKHTDKRAEHPKQSHQQPVSTSATLMTMNCWFQEDVAVRARMDGIANLLATHQPAVVGLQELTALLVQLLRPHLSRLGYSLHLQDNNRAQYFVGLCARVPLRAVVTRPFTNTIMSRGVLMGVADLHPLGKVVVGTTHLESPIGPWMGGFKRDDKRSQRQAQAATALRLVAAHGRANDVRIGVLMGDMNWGQKDGQFPTPDSGTCVDVWTHCNPRDPGFSYDGPRNAMLLNKLRSRLDRAFVFPLAAGDALGVWPEHAALVGTDPIPGHTFVHVTGKTLPVLPSDHFGVVFRLGVREEMQRQGQGEGQGEGEGRVEGKRGLGGVGDRKRRAGNGGDHDNCSRPNKRFHAL